MFIRSPIEFADWFNKKYPGAYRPITAVDVRELTKCGLIAHYRYYSLSQDGETIRGILQYEQLRQKKSTQESTEGKLEPPKCKMCEKPLPPEPEDKKGRPREYCTGCESSRNRERYRKWRKRKKKLLVERTSGGD